MPGTAPAQRIAPVALYSITADGVRRRIFNHSNFTTAGRKMSPIRGRSGRIRGLCRPAAAAAHPAARLPLDRGVCLASSRGPVTAAAADLGLEGVQPAGTKKTVVRRAGLLRSSTQSYMSCVVGPAVFHQVAFSAAGGDGRRPIFQSSPAGWRRWMVGVNDLLVFFLQTPTLMAAMFMARPMPEDQ